MVRKTLLIGVIVILASTILTTSALGWGAGTHMYIAKQIEDYRRGCIDLQNMYGAMAPDLNALARKNAQANLRRETHHSRGYEAGGYETQYGFEAVEEKACWKSQKAFAAGWITHNEEWGADYYAHLFHPINLTESGYVRDYKNDALVEEIETFYPNLSSEDLISAAEGYIEVGVDLLLEEQEPKLGREIRNAALCRSWTIPSLLVKAYPDFFGKGLLTAEGLFRDYLIVYGGIIARPRPKDKETIACGIALVLGEWYGVEITAENSLEFLETAMSLCKDDYFDAIEATIEKIKEESPASPQMQGPKLSSATMWGELKKAR